MTAAVDVNPVLVRPDQRPGLHDLAALRAPRVADVEHVDRRGLRRVGTAETRDRVEPVARHIAAADAVGIAEAVGQVARVDLGDLDHSIVSRLVGIAGAGIAERVVDGCRPRRVRGPEVRVLEHADVGHKQRAVVRRQRDAKRIAADFDAADHGGEVVRLGDPSLRIEPGLDLRHVDHVDLEGALIHDVEKAAVGNR